MQSSSEPIPFVDQQDPLCARSRVDKTQALLSGLLFDDAGQPMVSTHATKNRVRYLYYVSAPCLRGPTDDVVGSVRRVPAKDIELSVARALITDASSGLGTAAPSDVTREVFDRLVARVEVRKNQLAIHFKAATSEEQEGPSIDMDNCEPCMPTPKMLLVPWKKPSIAREIIGPTNDSSHRKTPIKAGPRVALIRSIGLGRYWLKSIIDDGMSVADIAAEHRCGVRMVNMTISLAFLSPTIVAGAVEGRLPRGLSVRTLRNPSLEWSTQMKKLGLPPMARK